MPVRMRTSLLLAAAVLAGCGGGFEREMQGRWRGPAGVVEFRDGRFVTRMEGRQPFTGEYEIMDSSRVVITYDDTRKVGPVMEHFRLYISGDSMRMCDPDRPRQPCGRLWRDGE
jgi:hypothetical protein